MAFTRDDLAAYEAKPQVVVPDPVLTAKPAAIEQETSQETPAAEVESSDTEASDQTESGDVTSDETEGASTSNATDESETEEGETEESTEGETEEGETEGDESTDHQPKNKLSRASKRIQELNSKALEAQDLAEGYKEFGKLQLEEVKALREENARLRGPKPADTAAAPAAADTLGPRPKLTDADVNFDMDVLDQKIDEWLEKKVKLTVAEANKPDPAKIEAKKAVEVFTARVNEFAKTKSDWAEKVQNPDLAAHRLHPAAQSVTVKAENGPAIVYHLATNIEEAKRIAALSPEDQVFEIGAIKARLETAKKTSSDKKTPVTPAKVVVKKSVSQAPPPHTPVPAGKRSQERDMTDPTVDMDDFARKHREGKNNARLAARRLRGLS